VFKIIMKFLFGDEKQKIKKQIDQKYKKAIEFQRNGNIRMYSSLMNEIANLEDAYDKLS
jgi:hypothetical protein